MSDRWRPDPLPRDGADGRGEAGRNDELETRQETEEAARSGRFPAKGAIRDDSNPIEPVAPRPTGTQERGQRH